ncbi:MAG: DUF4288 domain-containing protein [Cyanobacteriota bacterium]
MAYIPKDAKWYVAELVMECRIEGEARNVVHVNIVLVRADSPEEAFEKAEQLGKEDEISYLNPMNQRTVWLYRGLRDLNVIHDELEHGAELMFEERINVSEGAVQDMITTKSQLNLFRPDKQGDPSRPNYGCKEIMEEALRMISDSTAQHGVGADEITP